MLSKTSLLAATLAFLGVTAVPAGPGNPDFVDTEGRKVYESPASNDTMTTYGLLEVYDSGNWFDKFNVEAVCTTKTPFLWLSC